MKAVSALFISLLVIGCGGGEKPQAQAPSDTARPAVADVSYTTNVMPVFTAHCMPCHSGTPDAKSKFDLSKYDGAMKNVVAGKPDSSKLWQMLSEGKMPPSGKLDAAVLEVINKWISQGAKYN